MTAPNELMVNGEVKRTLFRSMELIMKNIDANIKHLDNNFEHTQKFVDLVCDGLENDRRFFLLASGRSAFILQCFATRLVHLGAEVHIVTNLASIPAMRKRDILIVLSGSGTTGIVVSLLNNYVNSIKPYGIVTITSHPETVIGRLGDITIKLKGRSKRDKADGDTAILSPEGTMFEQIAFCYLDAIVAELATKLGITNEDLLKKHSQGT